MREVNSKGHSELAHLTKDKSGSFSYNLLKRTILDLAEESTFGKHVYEGFQITGRILGDTSRFSRQWEFEDRLRIQRLNDSVNARIGNLKAL